MSGSAGGWVLGPVLALTPRGLFGGAYGGQALCKPRHNTIAADIRCRPNDDLIPGRTGRRFAYDLNFAELVPSLQTHDPMVIVTPSNNLSNGQQVEVRVTGFGLGGKVWLSECATATEANDQGCGHGLPAQTLQVTNNTGSGSMAFRVQSSAPPKANDYTMTGPYSLVQTTACW